MNLSLIYEAELAGAQNKVTPKTAGRKQRTEIIPKPYEHLQRQGRPTNPGRQEAWQETGIKVSLQCYCLHASGLQMGWKSNVPGISMNKILINIQASPTLRQTMTLQ